MKWIDTIISKIKKRLDIEQQNSQYDSLLEEYVQGAFNDIIIHTNSNYYDNSYESTLIKCVIVSWRKRGIEGTTSHTMGDITDSYESSDETSYLISKLPVKIRPVGYQYSSDRFNFPN